MGATTKNLPYPTDPLRPHIDLALHDLADKIDAILGSLSDVEIAALAGADLWDGKLVVQTDVGSTRKWRGLYEYLAGAAAWRSLVPIGAFATFTPVLTASGGGLALGTSPTQAGWYAQFGSLVFGRGYVLFGTAGSPAIGTGTLLASLPVAHAYSQNYTIGRGRWRNTTAGVPTWYIGEMELTSTTTAKLVGGTNPASTVADATNATLGFTPANGVTSLSYSFRYRV